jgi:predicted Rossmann fold flavoprotein
MDQPDIAIVGGGAAGFFAAITAAETQPGTRVTILEKGPRILAKVRISGGGRCNVTHACFDPHTLVQHYPRGGRALIGIFHHWGPADTVAWFESRGVRLKTENDGRMFPLTDDSATIIDCLESAAHAAGVVVRTHCGVQSVRMEGEHFRLDTSGGPFDAPRLLLAHGGPRAGDTLATGLGHSLVPPVPSLFTFHVTDPLLEGLAGVSIPEVEAAIPQAGETRRGPLLITHTGLSGPAILRLSAWAARWIHDQDYHFDLTLRWLPHLPLDGVLQRLRTARQDLARKQVGTVSPFAEIPQRLWERLAAADDHRWSSLTNDQLHSLAARLHATTLTVRGKSMNKDEFVTAGGVSLKEIDLRTMESRIRPGLHVAGEALDIDGVTGGFNFQAAWTTGRLAGLALAQSL